MEGIRAVGTRKWERETNFRTKGKRMRGKSFKNRLSLKTKTKSMKKLLKILMRMLRENRDKTKSCNRRSSKMSLTKLIMKTLMRAEERPRERERNLATMAEGFKRRENSFRKKAKASNPTNPIKNQLSNLKKVSISVADKYLN